MKTLRDFSFVAPEDRGASAAIGNFDGVHLGHRSVIDLARAQDGPLGVLTFEPHPRSYFQPDAPSFRLMSAAARAAELEALGVERLFEVPFNQALANLTAREFAKAVIADGFGLRSVVVGQDFCFGKGREGNVDTLKELGAELGFDVIAAPLLDIAGAQVSSTAIRTALSEGRPEDAAKLLGHWHRFEGPVIGGEQRGRELGYPTANMSIDGLHLPKLGVYAVEVEVKDGPHQGRYHGAASLGVRPMFGENTPNLETFLFDFSGDLYGATLSVALVAFLRPELKFDSLEALIQQMDADCAEARAILAA
ncbi:bifunctional riboflavin kinase/FAD synthetase [Pseudaestuariivita sp.]|uniref:bifunctional riboflavin kinase/FAD synthetase n=1 Tax=Pseudaestuariivita sp. TaxID=2211669 RepID=UPI004059A842